MIVAGFALALLAGRVEAAAYAWNADNGGNWNDTGKWTPTGYPNGVGNEALFVFDITADRSITQNMTSVTIGRMVIQDTAALLKVWTFAGNTIRFENTNAQAARIEVLSAQSGNGHQINSAVVMVCPLVIDTVTAFRFGGPVSSTDSYPLQKQGVGALSFLTSNSFTGELIIHGGSVAITEFGGRLTAVSRITCESGTTLQIGTARNVLVNRLPDTLPIVLRSGQLTAVGDFQNNTDPYLQDFEQVGELRLDGGHNTLTVNYASGSTGTGYDLQSNELIPTRLIRQGAATLRVRGRNLGMTATQNCCRAFFSEAAPTNDLLGGGGPPGSSTVSIIPYMVGANTATGAGDTWVTYDTRTRDDGAGVVGLRPLDTATEFVSSLLTAGTNDNVRLTGNQTLTSDVTVNSLIVQGGNYTVGGSGKTLTLNSGALLLSGSYGQTLTLNVATLEAAGRELIVHVVNNNTSGSGTTNRLTINSVIRNAAGLTFGTFSAGGSNSRALVLAATNTYQGPTVVQSGVLEIAPTGTLGEGDLTIRSGASLRQLSPAAISDGATVTIEAGAIATLQFQGTDRIGRLVVGETVFTAPGTYGHSSAQPTYALDAFFAPASGLYQIAPKGTLILVQ